MRRALVVGVVVVAGCIWLALTWATVATVLQHFFGFNAGGGNGSHYLFWSGSGSDLAYFSTAWGAITSAVILYRRHNCHEPRCWRVGRVVVDDKGTLSCFHHHPEGKPKKGHIARAHALHLRKVGHGTQTHAD